MNDTNNIFIEYEAYNKNSGINITHAQFYCINDNNGKYYFITTNILKEIINDCKTRTINKLFKSGYLLPKEKFLKYSIELNKYSNKINDICKIL